MLSSLSLSGVLRAGGGCEGVRLLECGRVQGALYKSERADIADTDVAAV